MLVFNCTQAACDFFTKAVKGKQVFKLQDPPASLLSINKENRDEIDRWQLHCVKLCRRYVLVAMQVDTRFAMTFVDFKRNNLSEFFTVFRDRYLSEVLRLAHRIQLPIPLGEVHPAGLSQWLDSMLEVYLCKGGDRSVQTHINQVLEHLYYDAYEGKGLPVEALQMVEFDESANDYLRKIGKGDYFYPANVLIQRQFRTLGINLSQEKVAQLYEEWHLSRWSSFSSTESRIRPPSP